MNEHEARAEAVLVPEPAACRGPASASDTAARLNDRAETYAIFDPGA